MKKTVTEERTFCDVCGQPAWRACQKCGKDLCYDCRKTAAKEYQHGVYFSGSKDGLYCLECDAALMRQADPKHLAYRRIEALRNEAKGWGSDFEKRKKEAESALEAFIR